MKILKIIILGYLLTIVSTAYGSLPNARTIYITSDDGPLPGTKNLINVMLKNKTPFRLSVTVVGFSWKLVPFSFL